MHLGILCVQVPPSVLAFLAHLGLLGGLDCFVLEDLCEGGGGEERGDGKERSGRGREEGGGGEGEDRKRGRGAGREGKEEDLCKMPVFQSYTEQMTTMTDLVFRVVHRVQVVLGGTCTVLGMSVWVGCALYSTSSQRSFL